MNTREVTRNYRLNQWIEIIRKCRSSGQTVSAWCAEHDINSRSYYYWLRKVREAACESVISKNGSNDIVPINISTHMAEPESSNQEPSSEIILRFGNITLELRNNASATLIENTLRAIQNVR